VSNFDGGDLLELDQVKDGGSCISNQVLYHLGSRSIDFDLLADCARRKVMVMAYSPLGQGAILANRALVAVGKKHGVRPAAIAIAWTLRNSHVVAIPKAASFAHVAENAAAADLVLDADDIATLDAAFPPPRRKGPLGML
jgi:diketogulonate reductase-like aldo/keto reductase